MRPGRGRGRFLQAPNRVQPLSGSTLTSVAIALVLFLQTTPAAADRVHLTPEVVKRTEKAPPSRIPSGESRPPKPLQSARRAHTCAPADRVAWRLRPGPRRPDAQWTEGCPRPATAGPDPEGAPRGRLPSNLRALWGRGRPGCSQLGRTPECPLVPPGADLSRASGLLAASARSPPGPWVLLTRTSEVPGGPDTWTLQEPAREVPFPRRRTMASLVCRL